MTKRQTKSHLVRNPAQTTLYQCVFTYTRLSESTDPL